VNEIKEDLGLRNISTSVKSLRNFMKRHCNEIRITRETILDQNKQQAETQDVLLPFLILFY
jgi:hypothetical protein